LNHLDLAQLSMPKNAIFGHFHPLCAKFHKNSLVIQKWQYLPPLEILGKLVQKKLQKMAKNSFFLAISV